MREVIEVLKSLQTLDLESFALEKRRAERPRRARESEEIYARAKANLDAVKAEIRDRQKTVDSKEVDLRDREEKIQKLEVQLNTAKAQKDYDAIRHQMSSYRADNSVLEDEILRLMTEIDSKKAQIGGLEEEVGRRKAQYDEMSRQVAAEVADLDTRIGALKKTRDERARQVPDELLERYNRVVASRDGVGLAQVIDPRGDSTCGGCNMSLTLHEVTLVMRPNDIVQCKACNRILWIA